MSKWTLLVLLLLSSLFVHAENSDIEISASPAFFESPSVDAHGVFRQKIHEAQKSIFLEMFHLTDSSIADELVAAKNRGVQVRVILDGTQLKSATSQAVTSKLDTAQVSWQKSSPAFNITHSKSMIVDDSEVIISTMNLTSFGTTKRDWGVVLRDASILADVKKLFETDWLNAQNSTGLTPEIQNPNLLVSPTNSLSKLLELISSAKQSIELTVENLTHQEILDALIQAQKRGVQVRAMTPQEPEGSSPEYNRASSMKLIAGGVQAKQMPNPATAMSPYLHGKDLIIDHAYAYLGSENFSNNSLTKSRELGVIVHDATIVTRLVNDFESDWSHTVMPDPNPIKAGPEVKDQADEVDKN